jgi:hypothetical protein
METGYKSFRSDVLRSPDSQKNRFGIEPEITGKVCKRKLRIYELSIAYYGRTFEEGKNITWRDGFRAVWVLFRVRLRDYRGVCVLMRSNTKFRARPPSDLRKQTAPGKASTLPVTPPRRSYLLEAG